MLSLAPWGWRAGAGITRTRTRTRLASQTGRVCARRWYTQVDDGRETLDAGAHLQRRRAPAPAEQSKDEYGSPMVPRDWRANIGVRHPIVDVIHSGTVTTADPRQTSIEELLVKVETAEKTDSQVEQPLPTDAAMVVLLSASYARHAVDGTLAPRLLHKLRPGHAHPLQACVAVVDRIPAMTGPLAGSEGFAYYYRDRPDLRPIERSLTPFDEKAQKPGFIAFQIDRSELRDTGFTIQVPLAQTVFSTGIVSTMTHCAYTPDEDGTLRKERERLLESLTFPLGFTEPDSMLRMHNPLVPLTPARVVRNSMGNIVRSVSKAVVRVENDKASLPSGSQPASVELEEAVSSYFTALNIPPEPVQVWALVMPFTKNLISTRAHESLVASPREKWLRWLEPDAIHRFWSTRPGESGHPHQSAVGTAIMRLAAKTGGRLCRVLSGGGGWGKKAGLLSLDPDVKYSVRDLRSDKGWEFDLETEDSAARSKQRALGDVVKEGDEIQFFLLPKGTESSEQDELLNKHYCWQESRSATFGTIPSTVDAADDADTAVKAKPRATNTAIHEPGMFGALSETGLALTTSIYHPQAPHPDAPVAKPVKSITKFDVPFSKVRIGQGVSARLADYRPPGENSGLASEMLDVELGGEMEYFKEAAENSQPPNPDLAADFDEILAFFAHQRKRLLSEKFLQQVEKLLESDLNPSSDGDIAALRTLWEHATLKLIQRVHKKVLVVKGRSATGALSMKTTDARKVQASGPVIRKLRVMITKHGAMNTFPLLERRSGKDVFSMKTKNGRKDQSSGQASTENSGNNDETGSQKVPSLITFHKSPKTFRKFAMPAEENPASNRTRPSVIERIRQKLKLQAARREFSRDKWVSRRQRIRKWLVAPRELEEMIRRILVEAPRVSKSTAAPIASRLKREANTAWNERRLHAAVLAASRKAAQKEALLRRARLRAGRSALAKAVWEQLMEDDVVEEEDVWHNRNVQDGVTSREQGERLEQVVWDYTESFTS
ncbi:hypothetical protein Tdes44962_MAKER07740 [Teratosphaeria destructans]|uniref:Uncharacterized protein n=1 Tax=Teratosphaeria destructans TaxID=418781 RepID=A0A9W7SYT7_9PEZI|nr:hypothetical protein Tdes44962_MAKER07740 [Teratosphaeria destructans]